LGWLSRALRSAPDKCPSFFDRRSAINNSTAINTHALAVANSQRPAKIGSRLQAGELPGDEVEMVFYQGKVSSCRNVSVCSFACARYGRMWLSER
jgi:hypothetical protein